MAIIVLFQSLESIAFDRTFFIPKLFFLTLKGRKRFSVCMLINFDE